MKNANKTVLEKTIVKIAKSGKKNTLFNNAENSQTSKMIESVEKVIEILDKE